MHFIYLGDTLLSTCYFFHNISQFSRKLCILGCFSHLRDRRKKPGVLGTAVMILSPKEYTKSIPASTTVTNTACDVGPLAANRQQQTDGLSCSAHTRHRQESSSYKKH